MHRTGWLAYIEDSKRQKHLQLKQWTAFPFPRVVSHYRPTQPPSPTHLPPSPSTLYECAPRLQVQITPVPREHEHLENLLYRNLLRPLCNNPRVPRPGRYPPPTSLHLSHHSIGCIPHHRGRSGSDVKQPEKYRDAVGQCPRVLRGRAQGESGDVGVC